MKKVHWKKDWPWIALAGIAIGIFFLSHHSAQTPAPTAAARGMKTRGRGSYANRGLTNDGGSIA